MFRNIVLAGMIGLCACAQAPQPVPHADGEIVTRAVQHAQAQVEPRRPRELGK